MVFQYDMDLYSLTPDFLIKYKIERYTSLIWTQRYSTAGDFQLVVPPTGQLISILHPGCFLGLRGVREVMIVETQSFDGGLLTVSGRSLVSFLNQRIAWFENPDYDHTDSSSTLFADYTTDDQTAGQFISDVVNKLVIDPVHFSGYYDDIDLDWGSEKFGNLSLAHIDGVGDKKKFIFPNGTQLYDGIQQIASDEHVGISLYLAQANFDTKDFVLRFTTYHGKDRTSTQNLFETVRFTPKTETLTNPKEVRGNTTFANVLYLLHKGKITVHYPEFVNTPPVGFGRRVIYEAAPDVNYTGDKLNRFLAGVAHKIFQQHKHTQTIDGQALGHETQYHFPRDYFLGDVIEVEGNSGIVFKARVTEYIRSQDQYGMKEYPTFEVMAEEETNYHADQDFMPFVIAPAMPIDAVAPPTADSWDPSAMDPEYLGTDPIFLGQDTGRDPLADNTDVNEGPVVPQGELGLSNFTDWETSDWDYDTDAGYYVHSGNVYLIGAVNVDGDTYPGSDVLLTNIPSDLAPETPISGRVLVDHFNSTFEYFYDGGLKIGPWLPVTINPEGTVTLDDGNPFRAVADSRYDFSWLSLIFSGISWPTSNSVYDAYGNTGSLDEYIDTSAVWQNIDGGYSSHDNRFHLNGTVQMIGDYATYPYDPLVHIPSTYQPKQSAESYAKGDNFCEVPQKDGYRCFISVPSGSTGALKCNGAQNPLAAGNLGCNLNADAFYQRRSDGYLARGSDTDVSWSTLAVTPNDSDVGVAYLGCSGSPVVDLPDIGNWVSNYYSATIKFKKADLIPAGVIALPIDYSLVKGNGQLSFICSMDPTMTTYYKVVYFYDQLNDYVYVALLLEECGDAKRGLLSYFAFHPSVYTGPDGYITHSWSLMLTPNAADVGYTGTLHPGFNYWSFGGVPNKGSDYGPAVLTGTPGSVPTAPGKLKGDMGFHLPPDCQIMEANISGLGDFPIFAPGDTIDLTGCGWPLY
jgi:hypothetical protein